MSTTPATRTTNDFNPAHGPTDASDRKRWMALYVLCVGVLMIVLDATIVNVALPSIQEDLGFSQSNLAWVVNAYLIAFGGLLLLAGRLGDLLGSRRVFLAGLTVFTAASVVCAVAPSQGVLIAARFIQGAGGALTTAVVLGMIVSMFPEPREQAKAIGVYGFVASAGGSIGLLAGGVLTEAISWHWIFFVNLPVGVATAIAAVRLVDPVPGSGLRAGADIPGALLLTGGLMLGVYAVLGVTEHGWLATQTLVLGAIADRAGHGVRRPPGPHPQPAHAAAPVRLAQRLGRQPRPGAGRRRHVLDVLPGRAVPAAGPRLRPARGRPGVPALDDRHGRAVGRLLRPDHHALRREGVARPEPRADRRRHAAVRPHAGRRLLLGRRPALDDAGRRGRRRRVPRADGPRDVGRRARGRRPRLGPGQHQRPGGRRGRPRRAGDPRHRAHRRPDGRGRGDARRTERRLPPRLPRRRRGDGRRDRHRGRRDPGRAP